MVKLLKDRKTKVTKVVKKRARAGVKGGKQPMEKLFRGEYVGVGPSKKKVEKGVAKADKVKTLYSFRYGWEILKALYHQKE